MLTKDLMATKMGEDQIMKIDADTWQISTLRDIGNPGPDHNQTESN